jgi:hypothetical protein
MSGGAGAVTVGTPGPAPACAAAADAGLPVGGAEVRAHAATMVTAPRATSNTEPDTRAWPEAASAAAGLPAAAPLPKVSAEDEAGRARAPPRGR